MQLNKILKKVTQYKGFIFTKFEIQHEDTAEECLVVTVVPRKNSKGICPKCGKACPTYDTARKPRWFQFVSLWAIPVWFVYWMRRIECKEHGIHTERVPWSDGKSNMTKEFMQFLANWARRLSYTEVANCFGVTYGKVFRSVEWIVAWGLKNRCLENIKSIGVDEICYRVGRKFATLVYQIDATCVRLLHVSFGRTEKSLVKFFVMLNHGTKGKEKRSLKIQFVCSDMWKPYLNVIAKWCCNALNILDRFHIKKHLNEAVDQTRRDTVKKLKEKGKEKILTKSRFLFLKNQENLTKNQATKLDELLGMNLPIIRAYLMKEDFERFWDYKSSHWAGRFLEQWCTRAMRSKIEPMKKFVKTIRNHHGRTARVSGRSRSQPLARTPRSEAVVIMCT